MSVVHTFGDFALDEALYELRRGAASVKLEPKVFDVLVYLMRHRERVVSKDELLAELWPGEHVSESVLPRCITALRKAVDDTAAGQRVIQTVHGRGYRFVAPVESAAAGTVAEAGAPAAAKEHPSAREDGVAEPSRGVFVGREEAMTQLRDALADAYAGCGRLVLVLGEPGIGKTRIAEEIASEGRRRGALVLTGRCYEGEGAPAFWPWLQILRAAGAAPDAPAVLARLGGAVADVAQLVPELRADLAEQRPGAVLAPEQARFRLFDAVSAFLRALAAAQPLVLVVDDLHWADKPSLLLLQFLAREMGVMRLLLVGTYRDVELRRQHPLAAALGDLAREPVCSRLTLRGLAPRDVARFLATTTGRLPSEPTIAAIHDMTEGNPFFIGEIIRLLLDRGSLDGGDDPSWALTLPQGVREAIGRRLGALSDECNRVLTLAAVLGRDFRLGELRLLAELDAAPLLEVLHEAVDARIVAPVAAARGAGGRAPTRYTFAHALIRETLYEELSAPMRVRLHQRAGEVLEETHAVDRGSFLGELAHHFYQAAAGGQAEKAISYATAAAERASHALAYEEAAGHYERALEALDFVVPRDDARHCALLLGLGEARMRAGERDAARGTFRDAAAVARAFGRPDLLARAALGFGGRAEFGVGPDAEVRALLDEALDRLPADDIALRSRLLSRMVGTVPYADTMATRDTLSAEAVALARRAGDPATLADALNARHWAFLGPDHVDERRALGDELLALAGGIGDKAWSFLGHDIRFHALLALGDVAAADRELDVLGHLATELRQPVEQWFVCWYRASRAIGDGRFDEGERWLREGLAIGQRAQHPAAMPAFRGQMLWLRGEQGRSEDIAEMEEGLRFLLPFSFATRHILQSALVNLYVDQGRIEDARREFEAVAAEAFRDVERDEHWMVTMAMLAEAVADLEDGRRAANVYELLQPFAARNVVHDLLRAYRGSTALYLALAATAMREWERAAGHFEEALVMNTRLGSRPYVARAEYEYARMLLLRGRRADRARARTLLASALTMAQELGMRRLEVKVAATVVPR